MKTFTYLFLGGIMAAMFVSCEKTIEFKSDDVQPKIVVNSVLMAGADRILVKVEKSRSILDNKIYFEALPGARVSLYENGEFVADLRYRSVTDTFTEYLDYGVVKKYPYERGVFLDSSFTIKSGATYRLEVTHEGFDPVSCETQVPYPVALTQTDYSMEKIPKQHGVYGGVNFQIKLNAGIADPANEDNFYRIRVDKRRGIELAFFRYGYGGSYGGGYGYSPYTNPDSIAATDTIIQVSDYPYFVYSMDPVLTTNSSADILGTETDINEFFTDELMNGNYNLSYWVNTYRDTYTSLDEYLEIETFVNSISRELYLYSRSMIQQSNTNGNPFAEPVPVYSNVAGGLGIFGSEAISTVKTVVGEYPVEGNTYIDEYDYRR